MDKRAPEEVYADMTDMAPQLPFYFRQVLAGPHKNFHYVIGDPATRDAAVIDPAFGLDGLFAQVEGDGQRIRTAIFTHGHWDHIGGLPRVIEMGVEEVVIHALARDHPKVIAAMDAGAKVRLVTDGQLFTIGSIPVIAMHTPGHQPESTCYLAGQAGQSQALFGGDTLFVDSCGRTDFPGGDTDAMFHSLAKLRALDGDVTVMPGHHYGACPSRSLWLQANENPALAMTDRDSFDALPFLRG